MTTRFLTLIHPCPVSDFRISQKCMRCRTVTFDKGVFCETITRFSFSASNNLEVPKKQIYQHAVEFASEIGLGFSSCTETSCRAIRVLTHAIGMAQAVKLSLRFYYYYTIRAQHTCMSIPWILKTKPFIFFFFTLLIGEKPSAVCLSWIATQNKPDFRIKMAMDFISDGGLLA